jgi:hypothetical protein
MKKKAIKKPETIAAMAKAKGISPNVVYNRTNRGWSLEKALITPVRKKKKIKPVKVVNNKPRQEIPQPSKTDESFGWVIFVLVCAGIVGAFVALSN